MAALRVFTAIADGSPVGAFIRLVAIVTSLLVLLGFAAFAVDELDRGSKHQQNALAEELGTPDPAIGDSSPSPTGEALRERQHSAPREWIDDANDVLLAPFDSLIDSTNSWVNHGVPALLALLLYGGGLGTLANMLPRGRKHAGDWRTA